MIKKSFKQFLRSLYHLADKNSTDDFGHIGKSCIIPNSVKMSNPKNLYFDDHVNIGADSILNSTNAKIRIKRYFVSAPGLRISTGQHERRVGRFLASITEKEKNHNIGLDKDVIINEDVWAGFGVTILAGVEIGRGCTIAAGSVVTHSLPPYCVGGGIPAKPIKFYWTVDQILEHESQLYEESDRFTREELENIINGK